MAADPAGHCLFLPPIEGIWTCFEYGYSSTGMTVTSSRSLSLLLFFIVFEMALAAPAILEEALLVLTYGACLFEGALFELIWSELFVPMPAVVDPAR